MNGAAASTGAHTAQPAQPCRRARALPSLTLLLAVPLLLLLASPLAGAARCEHASAAATPGCDSFSSSSSSAGAVHTAISSAPGAAWGQNGAQSGSEALHSTSRRLLQQNRLALALAEQRRRRMSALEQLLVGGNMSEADAAASAAAARAATSEGRGTSLLLSDLKLEGDGGSATSSNSSSSSNSSTAGSSQGPGRLLVAGTQGPAAASTPPPPPAARSGLALPPSGSSASSSSTYQPLCSATINYGASVGDASNKATADVPIFVGSFDVVATQLDGVSSPGAGAGDSSSWVLGWQFAAGEYIQLSRDVFGDDGITSVFMAPNLQPQGSGGTDASSGPAPAARLEAQPQRVAVFSNTSLGAGNNEAVFSFVGRKGPETSSATAPFRVAPPTAVFLNNHFCWPLFRPGAGSGSGSGSGAAAAAAAAGANAALGSSRPAQQVMVEVASPQLQPGAQPKQLQVEYLPVEFARAASDDPALFAKAATQFYFKISNAQAGPVYLDQVVLQYWFNGPLDSDAADSGSSSGGGNNTISGSTSATAGSGGMADVVARVSASQFRLTCSDATPSVGCSGLAWNVTPGLPTVFGARFTLNVWFPLTLVTDVTDASASSNSSSSSGGGTAQRFLLLPANASSSSNSSGEPPAGDLQPQSAVGPDGSVTVVQPLQAFQAIVAIEPRRFFSNISATNDYSFIETPEVAAQQPGSNSSSSSSSNSTGRLVRRKREANPRLPAYVSDRLAWGSPPVGGKMAPRPGLPAPNSSGVAAGAFPPGSYCQPSPGGGLVCGVDVLYCCLGSGQLNLSVVPPDWPSRLATGIDDPAAAGDLAAAAAAGGGVAGGGGSSSRPPGSGQRAMPGWAIALAVVLPALALAGALAAALLLRRRRRVQRRSTADSMLSGQQQGLWSAGSGGSDDGGGGGSLLPLSARTLPLAPASGEAHGWQQQQHNGSSASPLLTALLPHPGSSNAHGVALSSAPAGMQLQQQLAELQLLEGSGQMQPSVGQSAFFQQHPYASALAAAGMQHHLLRVLKPKVPSLPADVIAAAVAFAKQHQQQLQWGSSGGGDDGSEPGSPLARLLHKAARSLSPHRAHSNRHSCSSSAGDGPESPAATGGMPRANSWTGWLHEDAFEDDLLDQLLALHMRPPAPLLLTSPAAASGSPVTADGVWQQLQSTQPQPQQRPYVGAAVAAVEAAAAAINALMSGSAGSGSTSSPGDPSSCPSFFSALMATGGMIRPPGGAPIPLNVNFATEIQPNLGRLLGRGGFGHVYEAVWRGQRVAVKLLSVDTDDPAVLDAFLKEVALCACLRGCDRVVRLLGACLGGCSPAEAAAAGGSSSNSGGNGNGSASAAVSPESAEALSTVPSADTPTPFARGVPPDLLADDAPASSCTNGAGQQSGRGQGLHHHHHQQQQQQPQQLALIMELVEGGNLAHRIYHPGKRALSYLEILQVGLDVAAGLAYLHPVVVHRDLKPQNVLLDKQGRAKIADFGISRFKDPHRSYLSVTHQGGTPNYMAPELFNASRVDEAADVWSWACILYECLARQQPFGHLADNKSFNVLFKIIVAVAINKERPQLPADTPPRLARLIVRCWAEDPAARPHVGQLLAELEDMMKEALRERAERLGRGSRLSGSARSQSLPAHAHASSLDRASSSVSSTSGSRQQQQHSSSGGSDGSSPRRHVRGALTLPTGHVAAAPTESSSVALGAFGSELSAAAGLLGAAAGGGSEASHRSTPFHTLPTLPPSAALHLPALVAHAGAELLPHSSCSFAPQQQQLLPLEQAPEQARCVSRSSSCHSQYEWGCSCAACVSHFASASSVSGHSSLGTGCDAPHSVNSSPKLAAASRAASEPAALLPPLLTPQAAVGLPGAAGSGLRFGLQSRPSTGPVAPPTPSRPTAAGAAAPRAAVRHSRSSSMHSDAGLLTASSGLLSRQQSLAHPWQPAAAAASALQGSSSLRLQASAASSVALVGQASDASSSSSAWTRQQSGATSVAVRSAPSSPERGLELYSQQQQAGGVVLTVQPSPVASGAGSSSRSGASVNGPLLVLPVAVAGGLTLHRQHTADLSAHTSGSSSLYLTAPMQLGAIGLAAAQDGGVLEAEQQQQQQGGYLTGPHGWPDAVSHASLDQHSLAAAAAAAQEDAAIVHTPADKSIALAEAADADAAAAGGSSSRAVVVQRKVSFAGADEVLG